MESSLFLGVLVTEKLRKLLDESPKGKRAILINNQSDYLHTYKEYIGKRLSPPCSKESVELAQANLESLLQKLIPEADAEDFPIHLIATIPSMDNSVDG